MKIRIVDFHAELTSEKMSIGWYLDERVSGTYMHIRPQKTRILPGASSLACQFVSKESARRLVLVCRLAFRNHYERAGHLDGRVRRIAHSSASARAGETAAALCAGNKHATSTVTAIKPVASVSTTAL